MNQEKDLYDIQLVLDGDTDAYGRLVSRYKDMVFTLALRIVKRREEAEEVAQEAFIKAFRNLAKYKKNARFSSWLYRITYNAAMDNLKQRKKTLVTEEINAVSEQEIKSTSSQIDEMEVIERQEAIQESLDLLPEEDSFLLTLYYFEDLSVDEMATITDYTKSNVKVKLHRARHKLARILTRRLSPEMIDEYGK